MPIDINARKKAAPHKPAAAATPPAPRPGRDPAEVLEARTSAKLSEIFTNPLNPRTKRKPIDPDSPEMLELRESLRQRGQLQPIAVVTADHFRRIFEGTSLADEVGSALFVIIGGGRRYVAAMAENIGRLKITVIHGPAAPQNPADWLAATVEENVQRETLSVLENARSVADLRDYNTGRQVANLLHKSDAWVSQHFSLTKLPMSVQDVIESAPFSLRRALTLTKIEGEAGQLRAARKIAAELLGLPDAEDAAEMPVAEPSREAEPPSGAAPARASAKAGRPSYTPTQKLATTLGKLDRETIIEAMLMRFDQDDWSALVAVLAERGDTTPTA